MKDFLNDTLYPALFERLDTALPEFGFRRKNPGTWESTTTTAPDGHQGRDAGKTFVKVDRPFYLADNRPGRGRSIWDYIKERDGLTDGREVFRRLCELAGVDHRAGMSAEQIERAAAAERRGAVLEAANAFFIDRLHQGGGPGAEAARVYVAGRQWVQGLRGPGQQLKDNYTGGERMEVGFFPSLDELREHLAATFDAAQLAELLGDLPAGAGRVVLTLREFGRIVGFKFRAIADDAGPKYLNLKDYKKAEHLPGLTRAGMWPAEAGGRLVLVEGEADAMRAHAAGFINVASLGGSAITAEQIKQAEKAGARALVLLLDNDDAGKEARHRSVLNVLKYIRENDAVLGLFVARYPDGVKDFDELLRLPDGKERAARMLEPGAIWGAPRYLKTWLDTERAPALVDELGGIDSDVFRDELTREILQLESIVQTVDLPRLRDELAPFYRTWGIDPAAIAARADTVREHEARAAFERQAAEAAKSAAGLFQAGRADDAAAELRKIEEARQRAGAARFAHLLDGHNKAAVISGLNPPALKTRYLLRRGTLEPVNLELPAAAISVFAGASGHGKTTMLINLLLDLCGLYPDKEFHFFSLEESAPAVTAKVLNCYLDLPFSGRNEPALESYLKGDPQFIRGEYFSELREKEAQFWPLLGSRIFVHYLDTGTVEEFCDAVKWLHRRRNIGAIFADYIQLFSLENRGRLDRIEELKHVCLMLKNTATETGLPLCFGAQFNRTVTDEPDTHFYQNIGEAGDIERISALIVGLWNRTLVKEKPEKKTKDGEIIPGKKPSPYMAAKVLKWRGGPPECYAVWNYDGNKKRIYPDATSTPAGGTRLKII